MSGYWARRPPLALRHLPLPQRLESILVVAPRQLGHVDVQLAFTRQHGTQVPVRASWHMPPQVVAQCLLVQPAAAAEEDLGDEAAPLRRMLAHQSVADSIAAPAELSAGRGLQVDD